MLSLSATAEVYVYTAASDMRLGFDRLAEKIRTELNVNPLSGSYFVFLSRNRRKVKILYWDRDGYAAWLKRLEAGAFKVERADGYERITGIDLEAVLSGTELTRIKLRKAAQNGLFL